MCITNVRFIKGRSKMKKLKKQWNKVTVLLLTFGIVFGLFGVMPVQAQDGNTSGSTIFDVKMITIR